MPDRERSLETMTLIWSVIYLGWLERCAECEVLQPPSVGSAAALVSRHNIAPVPLTHLPDHRLSAWDVVLRAGMPKLHLLS